MSRLLLPALLGSVFAAVGPVAAVLIDSMDEIHFQAPKGKGRVELVDGKFSRAVRFAFDKDSRGAFFTRVARPDRNWDRAAGLSFWVKGDGSDSFGGLELIYDNDFAVRYDYCFPIRSKEWTKIAVAWADLVPVLPGARSKPLGLPGGNPPSRISAIWFGKWWYWRDYPAHSFAVDELRLEPHIDRDSRDYRPAAAPLARVLAKLKAGQPVTVVTMGDSLTDTRHWANRATSWPLLLKKDLEARYHSKVAIVNPAIGGTQLRQNLVLLPRWLQQAPHPDLVTFCFGGNDWEAGMREAQFRQSCEDAVSRIRRATRGKADVLILSSVPSVARWTSRAELAAACRAAATATRAALADAEKAFLEAGKKDRKALYVSDQVHLSPSGHELMARTVREAIERAGR